MFCFPYSVENPLITHSVSAFVFSTFFSKSLDHIFFFLSQSPRFTPARENTPHVVFHHFLFNSQIHATAKEVLIITRVRLCFSTCFSSPSLFLYIIYWYIKMFAINCTVFEVNYVFLRNYLKFMAFSRTS